MFDLNPLAQTDAWWQHLVMLGVAALIGYIIGYRTSRGVATGLEEELTELDAQLDDCRQISMSAAAPAPSAIPVAESEPFVAPEPLDMVSVPDGVPPVAPAVVATNEAPVHDNLKLVEGIGPKIEQLLNKEGILTFRQLSEASHERLSDLLRAAGARFHMHDPGSWPRQAELAADGKWEELREWQDDLKKGKTT